MLRGVDRHLDLADLRRLLKPFYSQMGRPSIDPELMMRMLIVGYCMGIPKLILGRLGVAGRSAQATRAEPPLQPPLQLRSNRNASLTLDRLPCEQ
jgi:hypothetical protein